MLFTEMTVIYAENHTKLIRKLRGQNAELLIVKESGTYIYHWANDRVTQ
jgi:hypothetical protein